MTRFIPAILSHTMQDLEAKLRACEPYFSEVQIDLMDGLFVPNKTISSKDLRGIKTPLKIEAHLMVQDPTTWIQDLMQAHVKKIIVHQEIGSALMTSIRLIKGLGLQAGIAVNPDSELGDSEDYWREVDCIQIMGVTPGHYGSEFQSSSVLKIRQLREKGFEGEIEVDGGVTPETAGMLKRSGAQLLVVGHSFFGSEEAPDLDNIGVKLETMRAALEHAP